MHSYKLASAIFLAVTTKVTRCRFDECSNHDSVAAQRDADAFATLSLLIYCILTPIKALGAM